MSKETAIAVLTVTQLLELATQLLQQSERERRETLSIPSCFEDHDTRSHTVLYLLSWYITLL